MTGIIGYGGVFAVFCVGIKIKPDLFEFLGDKYEAKYYYWCVQEDVTLALALALLKL